jgi:hypothetical protein
MICFSELTERCLRIHERSAWVTRYAKPLLGRSSDGCVVSAQKCLPISEHRSSSWNLSDGYVSRHRRMTRCRAKMARGDEVVWAGSYRNSGLGGRDMYKSKLGFVTVSVVSWSPSPRSSSSRSGGEVGEFVPSLGGMVNRLLVGKVRGLVTWGVLSTYVLALRVFLSLACTQLTLLHRPSYMCI